MALPSRPPIHPSVSSEDVVLTPNQSLVAAILVILLIAFAFLNGFLLCSVLHDLSGPVPTPTAQSQVVPVVGDTSPYVVQNSTPSSPQPFRLAYAYTSHDIFCAYAVGNIVGQSFYTTELPARPYISSYCEDSAYPHALEYPIVFANGTKAPEGVEKIYDFSNFRTVTVFVNNSNQTFWVSANKNTSYRIKMVK